MIFITIGSNKEYKNKPSTLIIAEAILCLGDYFNIVIESELIESPAWPDPLMPPYKNMVLGLELRDECQWMSPLHVLDLLQKVELKFGRERAYSTININKVDPKIRYAPRSLDLDLLLFDDRIINHPRLQVPHLAMADRDFVLSPFKDCLKRLNRDLSWRHPVTGQTIDMLLQNLSR